MKTSHARFIVQSSVVAALVVAGALVGCEKPSLWLVDQDLSVELLHVTVMGNDTLRSRQIDSVDVVEVYQTGKEGRGIASVERLKQERRVATLQTPASIRRLFIAMSGPEELQDCEPLDVHMLSIVAYETQLHRVAYFRYFPCRERPSSSGVVEVIGGTTYFTTALAPVLAGLGAPQ